MADLDVAERRKLAEERKALPERWIKRRARELNAEKELPEDW